MPEDRQLFKLRACINKQEQKISSHINLIS